MDAIPVNVRQEGADLAIDWQDGTTSTYKVYDLRCACPCASCRDEVTGERLLNPANVPKDIAPRRIQSVGNYALKIEWSDGHDTGIYAYDRLWTLGANGAGAANGTSA